jgi:hypothetical protein
MRKSLALIIAVVLLVIPLSAHSKTLYVTADLLRFRLAPIDGDVEYRFECGEPVDVLSIENGWAECEVSGDTVYACADYLSDEEPWEEPVVVTTYNGSLNIRNSPSKGAKKVGEYKANTQIQLTGVSDEWGKTEKGWIMLEFTDYSDIR